MKPELLDRINRLPRRPGVYLMKTESGEIVYVGKATDLRSRVRSYAGDSDPRPFVRLLDRVLHDIDYVVTANPKEALLLENTLIKKHRPRFNFSLRDDKNYLSIRIRTDHPWPRVDLVRAMRDDGARYFGPYHSAAMARQTVGLLNRHFHLRTCRDSVLRNRVRPCLQHQIGRCPAPCVLPVDREAYRDDVQRAILFLEGRTTELTGDLEDAMLRASDALAFEQAARYRDQLLAVRSALEHQHAVRARISDLDVVALHREGSSGMIVVAAFESGAMTQVETFPVRRQLLDSPELLTELVVQYYNRSSRPPPPEVLLSDEPDDADTLSELLSELRGGRTRVHAPQRGEKRKLVEFALENARLHFETDELDEDERLAEALSAIQRRFRLRQTPRVMECYDISNFQGRQIVASGVCFIDGRPERDRYRRYRIESVDDQDDFASMHEVISRRARRARRGEAPLPDLIVIDGGRGQLNAAVHALRDAGFPDQDIISLAKSRTQGTDETGQTTRSAERVFVPDWRDPVELRAASDERFLLERIRDEAHRFAITFHRQQRTKATVRSALDDIRGIGPTRRALLLEHVGSVKAIRQATLPELEQVPGLGRAAAHAVFAHFHPDEADPVTLEGSDDDTL